jgi:hypothetical protein
MQGHESTLSLVYYQVVFCYGESKSLHLNKRMQLAGRFGPSASLFERADSI